MLGIAYYFYSGTALSRKVGFPFLDYLFGRTRSVRGGFVWRFSSRTKRRWSAVIDARLPFRARFCLSDAVTVGIEGLLVSVGSIDLVGGLSVDRGSW